MSDYDQIGKQFEGLAKLAEVGMWAIFALIIIGFIAGGWIAFYLWNHVTIS